MTCSEPSPPALTMPGEDPAGSAGDAKRSDSRHLHDSAVLISINSLRYYRFEKRRAFYPVLAWQESPDDRLSTMEFTVEFYGLPRRLSGVKETTVQVKKEATLRDVVKALVARFPAFLGVAFPIKKKNKKQQKERFCFHKSTDSS